MLKVLCLLSSPLQLLCAAEYSREAKQLAHVILFLNKGAVHPNNQLRKTAQFLGFSNIIEITLGKNKILNSIRVFICLFRTLLSDRNYKNILIGDCKNNWVYFFLFALNAEEYVVVDDGFSTITYSPQLHLGQIPSDSLSGTLLSRFVCYFVHKKLKRCLIFTVFEGLQREGVLINKLEYLKKSKTKNKSKCQLNKIFFLGGKLSERNATSLNKELRLIEFSAGKANAIGCELVYLAKRSSSEKKLKFLKSQGISTIRLEYPLEIELLRGSVAPFALCGLSSTLLVTAPLINPALKIILIEVNDSFFNRGFDAQLQEKARLYLDQNGQIEKWVYPG